MPALIPSSPVAPTSRRGASERHSSSRPFVACEDVEKAYGEGEGTVRALAGIDLDIARGELVVLLGQSGSGKSTLLHLLGALETPTAGRVVIDGRDLATLDDRAAARHRCLEVGFVFQRFNLIPTLTAIDNVALPARLAGTALPVARQRAARLLADIGLGARASAPPDALSGGQQQRVAVARALVNDPALVLADEPTGNLDRATGEQVVGLLADLVARRGATLVLATHAEELAARATRVVRLADGRLA
jgi:ABC-type lipoprotein export system ATPase subunit